MQPRLHLRPSTIFKMAAVARRLGKMATDTTAFFLCDMQEKFRPNIKYFQEIANVANRLVRMAI